MSKRGDVLYLGTMLDAARRATTRSIGVSRSDFETNEDLQIVLAHHIRMIGEAARKVPDDVRSKHPDIPWREIIGMRHWLVHDYQHVSLDRVWEVLQIHLPALIAALERITPPEPPSA